MILTQECKHQPCCLPCCRFDLEKAADQVRHDDGVVHERVLAHAQGELQPAGRLPGRQVEAVALQQEVLQLVLSGHRPAHLLEGHRKSKKKGQASVWG